MKSVINANNFLAIALIGLVFAISTGQGRLTWWSLVALVASYGCFLCAFSLYTKAHNAPQMEQDLEVQQLSATIFLAFLRVAVVIELLLFSLKTPIFWWAAVGVGLLVVMDAFSPSTRLPSRARKSWAANWLKWKSPAIWAFQAIVGAIFLFSSGKAVPPIDVYFFQQEGCRALLQGINPYELRYRNIYAAGTFVYAPELVKDGILQFGYVYMPLTLLMAVPGFLLGDVRWALFFAMSLGGWCLLSLSQTPSQAPSQTSSYTSKKRSHAFLAAVSLLFFPDFLFVLFHAWSDPFVAVTFCAMVWCTAKRPLWLPVAVGLWLVSKQYVVLLFPLTWLLLQSAVFSASSTRSEQKRETRRFYITVVAVAVAVTSPMVLWNLHEFVWSSLLLQFKQPFRADSLSFLAAFQQFAGVAPPFWIPFVLLIISTIWALRTAPRTLNGFCMAATLVFWTFIAFNKQSFINYYYVVFAFLCCTIATLPVAPVKSNESLP